MESLVAITLRGQPPPITFLQDSRERRKMIEDPEAPCSDSGQLVEHFFRQEYANLVAVLTRVFGVSKIDLVEDMVGAAMLQAMNSWKHRGVPDNPAAWIHRVARNRIIDVLRREKTHQQKLNDWHSSADPPVQTEWVLEQWLDEQALPDSLLRMMFVCCHPSLDRRSQIALTLKILCGFSISEISRGLLMNTEAVKKRIQRAKSQLGAEQILVELPCQQELPKRLEMVLQVLYLMFNEGYSTSHGVEPIRDDICEEAARLCHMICQHESLGSPDSRALLALMLFHASRLDARTDSLGNAVLLDDQDRSKWDSNLIEKAKGWLVRSMVPQPSRFHLEAAIAQIHCSATSVAETDWSTIVQLYRRLLKVAPSPVYRLNCAIAMSQSGDGTAALAELDDIRSGGQLQDYYLLDCAQGFVHASLGNDQAATDAYLAALSSTIADHQKTLIQKKLKELTQ